MTTTKSPLRWVRLLLSLAVVAAIAVAHPAAAETDGTSPAVHIVAWGETVGTIAAEYGVNASTIIDANNLAQPDRLYAGQTLVIPGASPAPAPAEQSGTHVVQRGEGLYRIALNYGVTVADLMAANGISNPDAIYAGQVLVIPAAGYANTVPATGGPQAPAGAVHVVQPGEILSRISQRYGVSVANIVAVNNLLNADSIYAGQRLAIPGAGAPANNPPPAAETPVTSTHTVQPGETLGLIATRYGVSIAALVQANNISNPSLLYSGQQLVIPGGGTNSGPATQPPPTPSNPGSHVVQRGETLFRIAVHYGITVDALRAANGISGNTIYTGQTLTIPGGTGGPVPAPAPDPVANAPQPTISSGKQIIVKLSEQKVYAYENGQLLRHFVVSTGLPATPTVQGDFSIYIKYNSQRMVGPGYDLPGVPWVMYFYQGYGLHGTYWHNNFGSPMSHGCVNMRTPEAEWLYAWAPIGTAVRVVW